MTRFPRSRDNRRTIRLQAKPALLAVFACALACTTGWAQKDDSGQNPPRAKGLSHTRLLTESEAASIIAVARDRHLRRGPGIDCSHLVHTIYTRAGFSYTYADSSDLYRGSGHFGRVKHPQAGDLVVWPGHVGIVVSPRHHTFFSALSHGPGTSRYNDAYWRRRGPARFFRYKKTEQSISTLTADN